MRDDYTDSEARFGSDAFEMNDVDREGCVVGLALVGELDLASSGRLAERLDELATRGASVHLDISGLTFVDSSGLAVLLHRVRDARRDGWTLQIGRDGLQRQVRRVIELIGADKILWPAGEADPDAG